MPSNSLFSTNCDIVLNFIHHGIGLTVAFQDYVVDQSSKVRLKSYTQIPLTGCTLGEVLVGRRVIEFPTLHIFLPETKPNANLLKAFVKVPPSQKQVTSLCS